MPTVTVNVAGPASTLTNFVIWLPLSVVADLDASFWSTVTADGGDIRAAEGATALAVDVCHIDTGAEEGFIYVKIPSLTSSGTTIDISWDGSSTMPAPGGATGAYSVWSAFLIFVDFWGGAVNRKTGTALTSRSSPAGIVDGWWQASDAGHYTAAVGSSIARTWTVGAHFLCNTVDGSEQAVVAGAASTTANGRFIIGLNPTGDYISAWNDTDTYLDAIPAVEDQTYYIVGAQDDATNVRRVIVDGTAYSSATTVDRALDHFCIGGRSYSTSALGRLNGEVQYAWGTLTYLADAWLDHDYLNRSDPETFFEAPAPTDGIDSITPNVGAAAGGYGVTIAGLGFTGATGATIDGNAITSFSVVSDTEITGIAPAGTLGAPVDVVVLRPTTNLTLTDGFEYVAYQAFVTQTPILALDVTVQETKITQTPILVLALPIQPSGITQAPILVPNHPTPIPLPLPILPELPVVETWNYQTVVTIAERAKEQRSALRKYPRVGQSFDALIIGEADRRDVYQMLFKYVKQGFHYPLYSHSTKMAAAAAENATTVYFDPAATDIRVGEPLAFVDPATGVTRLSSTIDTGSAAERIITVATVEADGATFAEPLARAVPAHWLVCPAPEFRTTPSVGLGMRAVSGEFGLELETTRLRPVLRPDQSSTLITIDGMPVLEKRPLADSDVNENFDQNVNWLDSGQSRPEPRTNWRLPYINGTREFLAKRPADLDYWREFADTVKGRWKAFVFSTFRDDLPLAELPALSATTLVSTNIQLFDFWRNKAYRYVRIESGAGVIYRRVAEVTANYDESGSPVSVNVRLTAHIGSGTGANQITTVSFANICRLNSDTITLRHEAVDTIVSLQIRTVDA